MSEPRQYCTFFLNGLFFGVDVLKVQEVLRAQAITRVPMAAATIRGLINLRGQIVTAVDLRQRLQLPERAPEQSPMNVVIRDDDSVVSLLVDEIGDVVEVDEASFEPPAETLRGVARELIRGVYKLEDRLLLILDTRLAVNMPNAAAENEPDQTARNN